VLLESMEGMMTNQIINYIGAGLCIAFSIAGTVTGYLTYTESFITLIFAFQLMILADVRSRNG